jgi:hypothetical protein
VLDQAQSIGRIVTPIRRRHEIRRPQGFIPIQTGPLSHCIVPNREMLCANRVPTISLLFAVS